MADIVAIPNTIGEKLGDDGSNDLVDFLNIFITLLIYSIFINFGNID